MVHIEVCRQILDIKDIELSEKLKCTFEVKNDSYYNVTVCFASGKKLNKELGYVTHRFDFEHTLTITKANILISMVQIE